MSQDCNLLIILSPPRSFSSVVSTIIGEHPQLYGFPELHLFLGDTVQAMIDMEQKRANRYMGSPGVLRTLAELHDGIQTTASILKAGAWLSERRHWTSKQLLDYFLEKIHPRIGVEKSPVTSRKLAYLERAYALYPHAYYLHLTRHPISARKSMQEFSQTGHRSQTDGHKIIADKLLGWYAMHKNIIDFTSTLPTGQTIRIKGEDVLSEPDIYLPQIAEWMGLRTDPEAINAMKHPENSPYAHLGPYPAHGGNDPKFMQSPKLRSGRVREPSLTDFLESTQVKFFTDRFADTLADNGLQIKSADEISSKITHMANLMGYQ